MDQCYAFVFGHSTGTLCQTDINQLVQGWVSSWISALFPIVLTVALAWFIVAFGVDILRIIKSYLMATRKPQRVLIRRERLEELEKMLRRDFMGYPMGFWGERELDEFEQAIIRDRARPKKK